MKKYKKFEADPRTVMFANTAISLVGLLAHNIIVISGALACAVVLAVLLSVNIRKVIIKLRRYLGIVLAAAVLQSIFIHTGTVLLKACGIVLLTSGGILGGLTIIIRMGILLTSGASIASCGIRRNIQALIQLKIPYEIAFMVYTAIHFIPLMAQEMQDSLIAVQLRGIDLNHIPVRRRLKVYTYLFLPAAGSAIIKAQDLAAGIELRGFRAYPNRTSLTVLRMRAADYLIIALFVCGAAAVIIFYYTRGQ